MGKWITGVLKIEIHFTSVYVEDGQDEIDAIFPEGYDGEAWSQDLTITHEETDEYPKEG